MVGDGQVMMGEKVVMKGIVYKVWWIYNDQVVVGFVGSVVDVFNFEDCFEKKFNEFFGNL